MRWMPNAGSAARPARPLTLWARKPRTVVCAWPAGYQSSHCSAQLFTDQGSPNEVRHRVPSNQQTVNREQSHAQDWGGQLVCAPPTTSCWLASALDGIEQGELQGD
jgi:hypothetical protein